MSNKTTTTISDSEYIGDSLITINTNFGNLDQAVYTLVQTLTSINGITDTPTLVNTIVRNLSGFYQ